MDESTDIMSTPINELNDELNIDENNNLNSNQNNTTDDIIKNYELIKEKTKINKYNMPNKINYKNKLSKENMENMENMENKNKSNILYYLKQGLIIFILFFILSYPLFDTKILKLIPNTINQYDNITLIGVITKSLIGTILILLITKFI